MIPYCASSQLLHRGPWLMIIVRNDTQSTMQVKRGGGGKRDHMDVMYGICCEQVCMCSVFIYMIFNYTYFVVVDLGQGRAWAQPWH